MNDAAALRMSLELLEYCRKLKDDELDSANNKLIAANITALSNLIHVEEDGVDKPPSKRRRKNGTSARDEKLTETAQKRANAFLKRALDIAASPCSPSDLANLILEHSSLDSHRPSIQPRLEDAALTRALVGFSPPDDPDAEWHAIRPVSSNLSTSPVVAFCLKSMALTNFGRAEDDEEGLERRICARGKWLCHNPVGGARWIGELVCKIEVVRFHCDYEKLIAGNGGKARQSAILERLFRAWLPADKKDVDLDTEEGEALHADFVKHFDHERRSRKRMYDLYFNFGPAVLLDPFWTVSTCFHTRTKALPKILDIVIDELEGDPENDEHALHDRYLDTVEALKSLASFLGGSKLVEYVEAFISEVTSQPGQGHEEEK